jgi:hypothetical protein
MVGQRKEPKDLAGMSLLQVALLLRPGQAGQLLGVLFAIASTSFGAGMYVAKFISPSRGEGGAGEQPVRKESPSEQALDEISATLPNNDFQKRIRGRDAVRVFETFTNAVSRKDWLKGWECLSDDYQRTYHETPEELSWDYRCTKEISELYYIPERVAEKEETYLVDYEFRDYLPQLSVRTSLLEAYLPDVLSREWIDKLSAELTRTTTECFDSDGKPAASAREVVDKTLAKLSLRHFVLADRIVETIGRDLHWKPVYPGDQRSADDRAPVPERRLVRATMIRRDPGSPWKLQKYDSLTIQKPQ